MKNKHLRPNERIIYTDPNTNTLSVVKLNEGVLVEDIVKSHPELSKGIFYRIITEDKLPKDRIFRNAWTDEFKGSQVDICPDKARECIRKQRNKVLETLDKISYAEMRKPVNKLQEIDAEAQRLRDIPDSSLFQSDDIDKLKKVMKDVKIKEDLLNG